MNACDPRCPLGGEHVQYKPEYCRRCSSKEFAIQQARLRPAMVAWAIALQIFPFEAQVTCGHCGKQRARSDGFCGACGQGNGVSYVSYQVIAGRELSTPAAWRPLKLAKILEEKPADRQVVNHALLTGPVIEKQKPRRSAK